MGDLIKNMKTIAALILLASTTQAIKPTIRTYPGVTFFPDDSLVMGIDKDDLMQNNPSHWRKAWPEGDTDNGQDDHEVLGRLHQKHRSFKEAPSKKPTHGLTMRT